MKEYYAELCVTFDATNIEERDEILKALREALERTIWKVRDVQCVQCEEA